MTVIENSVPRSRSLAQLIWRLSNVKFKGGELPSENQTHGQRHNLCFLPCSTVSISTRHCFRGARRHENLSHSTEQPLRSEIVGKTHEPWKLDESPHTLSKAPTDSAGRSHPTVFSKTRILNLNTPGNVHRPTRTLWFTECASFGAGVRCALRAPVCSTSLCVLAPS